MAIDWTTFTLEVVNFLVLVWILKHFLYQPVLDILARRQADLTRTLEEARRVEVAAAELRDQFEHRLADWEAEKTRLRAGLESDLEAERDRQFQALTRTLATERERQRAQETHREDLRRRAVEVQAIDLALDFATRLLTRLAGPELERRLIEVFIEDLARLPEDRLAAMDAAILDGPSPALITSAFPIDEAQRKRITAALTARLGRALPLSWAEDAKLLAGLRLALGPWQLDLSLADELAAFAQAGNNGN